jgi:hypothetical protein
VKELDIYVFITLQNLGTEMCIPVCVVFLIIPFRQLLHLFPRIMHFPRERITKLITEWGRFTQIIGNQLFNRENGLVNRMHGLIIRGK